MRNVVAIWEGNYDRRQVLFMSKRCSRISSLGLWLLVACIFSIYQQRAGAAEPFRPFFVVTPRAREVTQSKFQGKDQLFYLVQAEYPAADVLKVINTRLKRIGWRPLNQDWLNPGLPSSHKRGWFYYEDLARKPASSVRAWQADWTNGAGDILTYRLEYSCPGRLCSSTRNLHDLRVIAIYIPSKLAIQIRESFPK